MEGTTAFITPDLLPLIDRVKVERGDESRSHTVRVLLREALKSRGLYELEAPQKEA